MSSVPLSLLVPLLGETAVEVKLGGMDGAKTIRLI